MAKSTSNKLETISKGIIRCPYCGTEYSPSEIYMPGQLVGKASNIIKDVNHKILYVDWSEEPEFNEHYYCYTCGKNFVVEASLSFKTYPEEEALDFSNMSTSLLD